MEPNLSQAGATCGSARENKHTMLQMQIRQVNEVSDALQELIGKIRGDNSASPVVNAQAEDKKTHAGPALSDVLTSGPDELNEHCNRLRDQIRTLDDLLF